MTDEELRKEQELQHAMEVKRLFDNPILVNAFSQLKQRLTESMVRAPRGDSTVIVDFHYQLAAVDQVQLELRRVMETGKLILKKEEERLEREKFFDDDAVDKP